MDDFSEGWSGLRRFGYDLVAYMKPTSVLELGVYRGTSFFSFCQAVKDRKLNTKITGVDTWEGDKHTGYYDSQHLSLLRKILKKYYSGVSVSLLQMEFDSAIEKIKDGSIDILHIDGLHTYTAAKHDYDTWKSKVSDNGVILFHDVHYLKRGFGVHKLWKDLKEKNATLELKHSNGLGILCMNPVMKKELKPLEKFWQTYYPAKAAQDSLEYQLSKDASKVKIQKLQDEIDAVQKTLTQYKKDNAELKKQLSSITEARFFKLWQSYCEMRDSLLKGSK